MKKIKTWWGLPANIKNRPLLNISDFVQEELPALVKEIENSQSLKLKLTTELREKINSLFSSQHLYRLIKKCRKSEEIKILLIDCKMCAMVLWHNQEILPDNLSKILTRLCNILESPLILTYEDITINNPHQDMRTFFPKEDEIGQNEFIFYRAHQIIEFELLPVIKTLENVISKGKVSEGEICLINNKMTEANNITSSLMKKLNTNSFSVFRKYLNSVERFKGPSGAFTGSYPLIDILWSGENIYPENNKRYLLDNIYFPSFQRKKIKKLILNPNVCIKDLAEKKISNFEKLDSVIGKAMAVFRGKHIHAVKKHLPDVYKGVATGTGGESFKKESGSTKEYLKRSLEHTLKSTKIKDAST